MSLPCGHAFSLDMLDSHVGISDLFELDNTGVIQKARADSSQALTNIKTSCPECGADFGQLRRYLLASKLANLEGNLDRLYAKFSRKLFMCMEKMYTTKVELDRTFGTFCKALKPSPLSGRTNEQVVRTRGSVLDGVLSDLARLKDSIVQQFESDVKRLETFLDIPVGANEIGLTSAYKPRFDALIYRGRLIVMEESSRMVAFMRTWGNPLQHTLVMIDGTKRLLVRRAEQQLIKMDELIMECEAKNLKRLEAETRLIQLACYAVLSEQGVRGEFPASTSLEKVLLLCQAYPDTAGQFLATYRSIKAVVENPKNDSNLYTKATQSVWWTWPKHQTGHLKHCRYGHPYSSATTKDCPECGREAPKPIDPESHLNKDAFLEAMKTWTFRSEWRGR